MHKATATQILVRLSRVHPLRFLLLSLVLLTFPVAASIDRDAGPSEPAPAAGRYLIASEAMPDPRFRHTVILLIEHGEKGSLGLIVNRPSQVPLSEFIDGAAPEDRLYFGGPVEIRAFTMLFSAESADETPQGEKDAIPRPRRIIGKTDFIPGYEAIARLYPRLAADDPRRVYVGYAGWGPGQLEAEIRSGGWHLISDSSQLIFSDEPEKVWGQLIRKVRGKWI